MELVFATRNHHKIRELNEILAGSSLRASALPPEAPEVEETGSTFRANAALKALSAYAATGKPALADDSGLCVDALDGAPGVWSARYAGPGLGDAANNTRLLADLQGVRERGAHYVCVLALVCPEEWVRENLPIRGVERVFDEPGLPAGLALIVAEGRVDGEIVDTPSGSGGFGYDPHFWVPEFSQTMAELPSHEKHRISHRGTAMRALSGWLTSLRLPQLS